MVMPYKFHNSLSQRSIVEFGHQNQICTCGRVGYRQSSTGHIRAMWRQVHVCDISMIRCSAIILTIPWKMRWRLRAEQTEGKSFATSCKMDSTWSGIYYLVLLKFATIFILKRLPLTQLLYHKHRITSILSKFEYSASCSFTMTSY